MDLLIEAGTPANFAIHLVIRSYIPFYYCAPIVNAVLRSVCLSVRENISGTAGPIFTKFSAQIACGRGSVLLWRRCDALCTSGFMDDVAFGRNGPYGASGVATPGRSLMSMNALLLL